MHTHPGVRFARHRPAPTWRREALRTTLWLVPTMMVAAAVLAFVVSYRVDRAAYAGRLGLPRWIETDDAGAARQVLIAIAASMITVAGVVFSITILALTLASQQFGPRMLRNFIRDRGTQVTLGAFVATFVYSVLALGSVGSSGTRGEFVPHASIALALGMTLGSLGVLIYFIHHVASSIQLTSVVAGIARDLDAAVDAWYGKADRHRAGGPAAGLSVPEIISRMDDGGVEVPAPASGFLQAIGQGRLVRMATRSGAVIRLVNRPGHFVVEGRPLAVVWPGEAAPAVTRHLERAHVIGSHRTLTQDIGFAVDQLVEIALRALSPAVNDTFTALTCIDWLGAGLCKISSRALPDGISRDGAGQVRLIEQVMTYDRLVDGAYHKIRQAGRGMPAVYIRQLQNLAKMAETVTSADRLAILTGHGAMIMRACLETVTEENDRRDVRSAHESVAMAAARP